MPTKRRSSRIGAVFLALASLSLGTARAEWRVLTTTPDLQDLVRVVVGKDRLSKFRIDSITKGTQDPHFVEAKPSFMVLASRADLVFSTGLELEDAWLNPILQGSRNPKVQPGHTGRVELGSSLEPLEVPEGPLSRSEGDVHPQGNPHVLLDPLRAVKATRLIADHLGRLDPEGKSVYESNATLFDQETGKRLQDWKKRIQGSGVRHVVTYHKTLNYFLKRFEVEPAGTLEPKPGIPPTSGHILKVIQTVREKKIRLVLIENYFDGSAGKKIQSEVPGVRVENVPVSVGGAPGIDTMFDLYENLVQTIEGKKK